MTNPSSAPPLPKNLQGANPSATMEAADTDAPRTPWHDMDLEDLHRYRHAHRLYTPTSQQNPQAHLIFAHAARTGLYAPGTVAARRKARQLKKARTEEAAAGLKERTSSRLRGVATGVEKPTVGVYESSKQTKEQLAVAVRKHFNAMSVSEGDVVARFIYVVRHAATSPDSDQDKAFRLRFKP